MSAGTRSRILGEARELFVEHGAKGVSMRGVAARAGITPMAIYRHFPGREALLESVVRQGHDRFLTYLQAAMAAPTPQARFVRSGAQYLRFAREHPRDYSVLFLEVGDASAKAPRWQDAATFRFLVDRVRECADAGVLVVDDPEEVALSIWAHIHGLVSLHLARKLPRDERAFRRLCARSLGRLVRAFAGPRLRPIDEKAFDD
jgi:AcrR family transcriptional regulator